MCGERRRLFGAELPSRRRPGGDAVGAAGAEEVESGDLVRASEVRQLAGVTGGGGAASGQEQQQAVAGRASFAIGQAMALPDERARGCCQPG